MCQQKMPNISRAAKAAESAPGLQGKQDREGTTTVPPGHGHGMGLDVNARLAAPSLAVLWIF